MPRTWRGRLTLLGAVVSLLCVGGCLLTFGYGYVQRWTMETMSQQQAAAKAEEHIRQAATALPGKPELELATTNNVPCDDVPGLDGRDQVERSYWLHTDVSNAEVFDIMRQYWTTHDYKVTSDRGLNWFGLTVKHTDDGYGMGLQVNDENDLLLWVNSPCVVERQ